MTKTISNILFKSEQTFKSSKVNNVTKLDIEYCLMDVFENQIINFEIIICLLYF